MTAPALPAVRQAWVYAADRRSAVEVGRPLAGLGFRTRHVAIDGALALAPGPALPPPSLAVVVAAKGEPPPAGLCNRLHEDDGFAEVPLVLVLEPEHLAAVDRLPAADELLIRPYRDAELGLRVARARREVPAPAESPLLRAGTIELDDDRHTVAVGGRPLALTHLEYELLRFFMREPRRAFTRETLLRRVWGYEYYGGARTVDVHVRRLRAKLGLEEAARIVTVRSLGYRFEDDD